MTSNQKPPIGFGFSTPENPRIRIFSKCIRILAPQFKKGFFQNYALTTYLVTHKASFTPEAAAVASRQAAEVTFAVLTI